MSFDRRSGATPGKTLEMRLSHAGAELEVRRILAGCRAFLAAHVNDPRALETVELVLAEVLNNIVEHAYAGRTEDIDLTLRLRLGTAGLECQVNDRGAPLPGGAARRGLVAPHWEDLPEGGFGWNLIRRLTEDLSYSRRRGQNRLSFRVPLR